MREGTCAFLVLAVTLWACSSNVTPRDGKISPPDLANERARDSAPHTDLVKIDARQDAAGPTGWAFGGTGPGPALDSLGFALAGDGLGNLIFSGIFRGAATFGGTTLTASGYLNTGVFVVKVAPEGNLLWAVGLPAAADIYGANTHMMVLTGLAADAAGNIFVAAQFAGQAVFGSTTLTAQGDHDVLVTKLDPTGKVIWAMGLGGPGYDQVSRLILDGSGNLTVAGEFSGTATFGGTTLTAQGANDSFIARLDGTGKVLWAAQAASNGNIATQEEIGLGLTLDSAGNTYASGMFYGTATLGSFTLTAKSTPEAYIAKLDPSGKFLWASSYSGGMGPLWDVVLDGSGNLFLTGTGNGWRDLVVTKVDPTGKFLWASTAHSTVGAQALGLTLDAAGNITVAGVAGGTTTFGSLALTANGERDVALAKLDSSGTFVSAEIDGGVGWDQANAVKPCGTDLCIVGTFSSKVTFGGTTLTSKGSQDAFVWRRPAL